jgi:di/tricarboxylate transporter
MSDIAITFAVLAAIVLLFVWGRLPVEVVAIGAALVLWATGVLTIEQTLAGFGDPVVIFIATLFVVSEGLEATGVTAWAGQQLMARSGASETRLLVLMTLVVAGLTAVVTVNAAVAALLPVIMVTATRLGRSPSKLLIPLCFGAHAGSQLALTGSNVNMVVSNAAIEYGVPAFGFFEFALAGIPLLIGTTLVLVLLSDRLLPDRTPRHVSADLSRHARTLARQYGLSAGDDEAGLFGRETGLAEVLIPPRSPFIGDAVTRGMVTDSGDLVVVGIQRGGRDLATAKLQAGDALVLQGPWHALETKGEDPGVIAVDEPGRVRRQTVPFGLRAWESLAVLAGMVVLLVTGLVPPAVAGLLAAGTLIVLRVLSMEQAYRSVTWTTVVLVAAMLPLSTAMFQTGAADLVADLLIRVVGGLGPYGLLAGLFVVTAIFGQLISNTATALIMIPIAAAAAAETGVDLRPVLMSVCVASAAALLTPVATPVNLIAMGAAGYRFGDYWRLGIVVMGVFFVVSVLIVPVIWPFA